MEKTARELFKEMGWKCEKYELGDTIEYQMGYDIPSSDKISIIFDFYYKEVELCATTPENKPVNLNLSLRELQAINKQVEELGWGKEEE